MPDRFIKTVNGVHGGALVIVGLGYIATGIVWVVAPSLTRAAGIDWMNVGWVTQDTIGITWLLAAVFILFVGLFSKGHKNWEAAGYFLATFIPGIVVSWFLVAALLGDITILALIIVQLVWPTILVWWIGVRAKDSAETVTYVPFHKEDEL